MEQVLLEALAGNKGVQEEAEILEDKVLRCFVGFSEVCKRILLLTVKLNAVNEGNCHGYKVACDNGPVSGPEYHSHQGGLEFSATGVVIFAPGQNMQKDVGEEPDNYD